MDNRRTGTIIVIGRRFGCGGRETGKALAKALGIPYYDKELLMEAATASGIGGEILKNRDEHKPSFFSSFPGLVMGSFSGNYCHDNLSDDKIYDITSASIRQVADKGGCVIVGRTADYVLRDRPNLLSVFLHAPIDKRAARIVGRGDCKSIDEARKMASKRDSSRRHYYDYYTGRSWGNADNYDLSLDASSMPTDAIVDLLIHFLDHRH